MTTQRWFGLTRPRTLLLPFVLLALAACSNKDASFFSPLSEPAPADLFPTLAELDGLTLSHDFVQVSNGCPGELPTAYSALATYTVSAGRLSILFEGAPVSIEGSSYDPSTGAFVGGTGPFDLGPGQQIEEAWTGTYTRSAGSIGYSGISNTNFIGLISCNARYTVDVETNP